MTFQKKYGPGEGFSVRPGGEMAADEDDVEGHMSEGSGRIDVSDKRHDEDDTEGHRMLARASDEDDTEGHRMLARASDEDDTEGHRMLARASDEDDTEGHRMLARASDEDDTEGHRMLARGLRRGRHRRPPGRMPAGLRRRHRRPPHAGPRLRRGRHRGPWHRRSAAEGVRRRRHRRPSLRSDERTTEEVAAGPSRATRGPLPDGTQRAQRRAAGPPGCRAAFCCRATAAG